MDGNSVRHAAVVLVVTVIIAFGVSTGEPLLVTFGGNITGLEEQVNGKTVEVFYGIPYAAPPLGEFRFNRPTAPPIWTTARDGTVKPPACWQLTDPKYDKVEGLRIWKPRTGVSEDCLYLNVWRPKVRSGPKKIMVWVHGGGFWAGSAVLDAYDGSELAAREDVILVTIAYRLGVPGFLITPFQKSVNMGLFDQRLALTWVRENAVNLGGSYNDVTIFGEDAGATSIGFHLMNPNTLFTNAIMQGGSPLASWAVMDRQTAAERSLSVFKALGADKLPSVDDLKDWIIGLSVEDLTKKFLEMELGLFELPLGPVVDGSVIPSEPREALQSGNIQITDVIIGVNKNEGVLAGCYAFKDVISPQNQGKIMKRKEFRDMILRVAHGDEALQKVLLKQYHREHVKKNRRLEIMDAAIGDSLVKCPVLDFAREYTKRTGRVYLYSFEQRFSTNPWPEWVGVPHSSEVEVVFGTPLDEDSESSEEEKGRIEQVMGLWTSFAKTGIPSITGVNWPMFTPTNEEYIKIDETGITPANSFRHDLCNVWLEYEDSGNDTKHEKPGPGTDTARKEQETGTDLAPEKEDAGTDLAPEKEDAGTDLAPEKEDAGTDLAPEKEDAGTDLAPEKEDSGTDLAPEKEDSGTDLAPEKEDSGTDLAPEKEDSGTDLTPEKEDAGTDLAPEKEDSGTDLAPEKERPESDTAADEEDSDLPKRAPMAYPDPVYMKKRYPNGPIIRYSSGPTNPGFKEIRLRSDLKDPVLRELRLRSGPSNPIFRERRFPADREEPEAMARVRGY